MNPANGPYRRVINLPNILTFFRISLIPVLVVLLLDPGPRESVLAALTFFLACWTDFLDGYLARRHGLNPTQVANWNGLGVTGALKAGQRLTLYLPARAKPAVAKGSSRKKPLAKAAQTRKKPVAAVSKKSTSKTRVATGSASKAAKN